MLPCRNSYFQIYVKKDSKICSNHFSIFLDCGGLYGRHKYFKIENLCLENEGFVEIVKCWWNSYTFSGSRVLFWLVNLKLLNKIIRFGIMKYLVILTIKRSSCLISYIVWRMRSHWGFLSRRVWREKNVVVVESEFILLREKKS